MIAENLKGCIAIKYGTQKNFAKLMGISNTTLNNKVNGKVKFSQDEIVKCVKLLNLTLDDVNAIFFNNRVQKTEHNY